MWDEVKLLMLAMVGVRGSPLTVLMVLAIGRGKAHTMLSHPSYDQDYAL